MEKRRRDAEFLSNFSDEKMIQISERAFMSCYAESITDDEISGICNLYINSGKMDNDALALILALVGAKMANKFFGLPEEDNGKH